eukprot:scaffold17449_cov39-Prasinocladus_malaysianus.AAC.1
MFWPSTDRRVKLSYEPIVRSWRHGRLHKPILLCNVSKYSGANRIESTNQAEEEDSIGPSKMKYNSMECEKE